MARNRTSTLIDLVNISHQFTIETFTCSVCFVQRNNSIKTLPVYVSGGGLGGGRPGGAGHGGGGPVGVNPVGMGPVGVGPVEVDPVGVDSVGVGPVRSLVCM